MFSSSVIADDSFVLFKQKQVLTLEWKTYELENNEVIALYGGKSRKFLTDTIYWGEAGYGALSGKRSGYLEGGVFLGNLQTVGPCLLDSRLFFGAGGGGGATKDGMLIHATVGIGAHVNTSFFSVFELGYLKFIQGNIESITMGFTINRLFWKLTTRG